MSKSNDQIIIDKLSDGSLKADANTGKVYYLGREATGKSNGYVCVSLSGTSIRAHRVVWIASHGPVPSGLVINHRNLVRHDNRLVNLEAISQRQNVLHAIGSHQYEGIRPADVEAVDPAWLADMLRRAANGEGPPERGSGPTDCRVNRARIKYAI